MRKQSLLFFVFVCCCYMSHAQQDTSTVNQLLNLSLEELMNVKVVTASGFMQTASEAPSTITVITATEIEERGYEQLEDALRDVPGIDMIHINGYAPTLIYFRGMYGAENLRALLMIDGIVENNILGSNDLAGPAYNLHNVERIEIIWGPVSALYGANAFGGVINIITKKGADINGLHAEQGIGTFNTSFENINFGIKRSNLEFAAAATLYNTDGPKFTNRDPNYDASSVDKAYSFNTTLSYYGKKTKTTVGYRTYKTPMGWGTYSNSPTVFLGLPSQGNFNTGVIGVLQSDIRGERSGVDAPLLSTWFAQEEYKPNDKINFLARVQYRETGIADDSYIYVSVSGTRLIRLPITSYSNRVGGELNGNFLLSEKQRLTAGIQFTQDNVESGARQSTIDFTTIYLWDGRDTLLNLKSTFLPRKFDIRNNFGSYFQYNADIRLLGKTSFTIGARYDKNSYWGDAFSPRIAIVNQPNKKLTFKFQYGHAFRAPTNLEIYQTPADSDFSLKKEQIRTYEVDAIYAVNKNLRLQVNGFSNLLTDVILLTNLSSSTTPDKNPGKFKIYGVETVLNIDLAKSTSAFFNFTYQRPWGMNLLTGTSGQLPGVAKFKGNAGVTTHIDDFFTLNLTGNWVGERRAPRTDPYGPVDGYFLLNCTLSTKQMLNDRLYMSLCVRNILNTKWYDPGFRTADGNLYSTVLEQPGINGIFKIGVNF